SEGLLEFRRGIGTFVRGDRIDYDVRSLVSFTDKAQAAGLKPSTKLLAFEKVRAQSVDPQIVEALQVLANDRLWQIKRVRLADDKPVILEHRYVVYDKCPKLTAKQAQGSLYNTWTQRHHLQIAGAQNVIAAVSLTAAQAKLLKGTTHAPALQVVATGYLQDDQPLWWEQTLYRADRYTFQSRLGPIQIATPPQGMINNPHAD
ncbi:MAG: GntR family transcriptional regulator, partial [Phycisphaeraceae bacterium JB051]